MEEVNKYIKHHTLMIAFIITMAFAILYAGEIYLYRQTVYLNKMISEGLMQIKEENRKMMPEKMMKH